MNQSHIKILKWDTDFFNLPMANLDITDQLPDATKINQFIIDNKIQLTQCCVDINNQEAIYWLESNGFHFVDVKFRLLLNTDKFSGRKHPNIQIATEEDTSSITAMTKGIFTENSRYNWRNIVSKDKIDEFYTTWITNSIAGSYDDFCFKYTHDNGKNVGFATIKHLNNNEAYIGIIGLDPNYYGQNIGSHLMQHCFAYAKENDLKYAGGATQGRNFLTQGFLFKNGMYSSELKSWYYRYDK